MAEMSPFTILQRFSAEEVLCSIGYGPDGDLDSAGEPYRNIEAASETAFIDHLVELAGDNPSVIIEWRAAPEIADSGAVLARLTVRKAPEQGRVGIPNERK